MADFLLRVIDTNFSQSSDNAQCLLNKWYYEFDDVSCFGFDRIHVDLKAFVFKLA